MTVQIPDPGLGDGRTGDNEYVFRSKVKSNFSDQSNAASRLVGTKTGEVAEYTTKGLSSTGIAGYLAVPASTDLNAITQVGEYSANFTNQPASSASFAYVFVRTHREGVVQQIFMHPEGRSLHIRNIWDGAISAWTKYYNTANTTTDSNGALKPSSPILRVFSDHIESNDDAEKMDATFIKNGVGDYTIENTTGLRTDGWYIVIPNDLNGNPKVAVTLEDKKGVISLKTYKRIFSMETFTFTPDLDSPVDIPDGRWIDLRFNDIETDNAIE